MDEPRKGFAAIAMRYFGKQEGQSLGDFGAELKELTDDDVRQLRAGIESGSETY